MMSKNRWMVSVLERVKSDVEATGDAKAISMANDLLYHFCWKLVDEEKPKQPEIYESRNQAQD